MRIGDRKNATTTWAAKPSQLATPLTNKARRLAGDPLDAPVVSIATGADIRLLPPPTRVPPRAGVGRAGAVPNRVCGGVASLRCAANGATRRPKARAMPGDAAADA